MKAALQASRDMSSQSLPKKAEVDPSTMAQFADARVPCRVCGRKFNPDRIAKHQVVCAKNATKKPRKQFMSAEEARLRGTDFVVYKDVRADVRTTCFAPCCCCC